VGAPHRGRPPCGPSRLSGARVLRCPLRSALAVVADPAVSLPSRTPEPRRPFAPCIAPSLAAQGLEAWLARSTLSTALLRPDSPAISLGCRATIASTCGGGKIQVSRPGIINTRTDLAACRLADSFVCPFLSPRRRHAANVGSHDRIPLATVVHSRGYLGTLCLVHRPRGSRSSSSLTAMLSGSRQRGAQYSTWRARFPLANGPWLPPAPLLSPPRCPVSKYASSQTRIRSQDSRTDIIPTCQSRRRFYVPDMTTCAGFMWRTPHEALSRMRPLMHHRPRSSALASHGPLAACTVPGLVASGPPVRAVVRVVAFTPDQCGLGVGCPGVLATCATNCVGLRLRP